MVTKVSAADTCFAGIEGEYNMVEEETPQLAMPPPQASSGYPGGNAQFDVGP